MDIYDFCGNVAEWCADVYAPIIASKSLVKNPMGPGSKYYNRVVRGGSWQDQAKLCQVFIRRKFDPREKNEYIGFRIAK